MARAPRERAPREPLPAGIEKMRDAKRLAYEALPPEERAEADTFQRQRREDLWARRQEKTKRRRDRWSLIFARHLEGAKLEEIAAELGETSENVRKTMALWGFKLTRTARCRPSPAFLIKDDHFESLRALSNDLQCSVSSVLSRLIEINAVDDAFVARRSLHVKQVKRP